MAHSPITTLTSALDACAEVNLGALSEAQLAAILVDTRSSATRLQVEIARVVHAADQAEVWRSAGATSMEVWLAGETNTTVRTARDQVRLADTLAAAPIIADTMRDGDLSIDNARLLGAVVGHDAFAGNAADLVELASGAPRDTKLQLENWLTLVDAQGEAEREHAQRLKRHITFTPNSDGMVDVKGVLTIEDAEHMQIALRQIAGAAYANETGRPHHTRVADALTALCRAYSAGEVVGGREQPRMLITAPFETIFERAYGAWCGPLQRCQHQRRRGPTVGVRCRIEPGHHQRQKCCTRLRNQHPILFRQPVPRVGTSRRWLSMAGCDRPPGWCEAHHVDEVIRDDGPTDVLNLTLLCSCHHHYAHSPEWGLVGDANNLYIRRPDGTLMSAPPKGHITGPIQPALQLAN